MGDRNLNELLKWSIANSAPKPNDSDSSTVAAASTSTAPGGDKNRGLTAETLAALMGGPSDADLMRESMLAVVSDEISVDNKLIALDNLEQLIESLDNANLLSNLGLWTPLLEQLGSDKDNRVRRMAAWCVGTAAQNNAPCQERLLALGGIEILVSNIVATEKGKKEEGEKEFRLKAVYALSSAVRNYQPALDVATAELEKTGRHKDGKVDATDMDAVDAVFKRLRDEVNGIDV